VRVAVATFKAGTHEELHWHAIEVFYYVMAGSSTVRDYHGKAYQVGAGSAIYAPPGIAGSHEWEVGKDGLQLLSVRATLEATSACSSPWIAQRGARTSSWTSWPRWMG
jgi:mannose-6-phosphate isomerase-like protein (cupin superfamily)